MRKKLLVAVVTILGVLGTGAGTSFATHPHHIDNPGTCVDRNGKGFGTGDVHSDHSSDPGDTTFHERFHKGRPGSFAFEQANNPASVSGGTCN